MSVETGGQSPMKPTNGVEQNSNNAFDPENFQPVLLIQLMRLYDLGLAFLSAVDPVRAEELVELHSQGHTFCPPPKFIQYEEADEVEV